MPSAAIHVVTQC